MWIWLLITLIQWNHHWCSVLGKICLLCDDTDGFLCFTNWIECALSVFVDLIYFVLVYGSARGILFWGKLENNEFKQAGFDIFKLRLNLLKIYRLCEKILVVLHSGHSVI